MNDLREFKNSKEKATYWRRMAYVLSTRKERRELFGTPIDEIFFVKYKKESEKMDKCKHKWGKWQINRRDCLKCDNEQIKFK